MKSINLYVDHNYYCSDDNYFDNGCRCVYSCLDDFLDSVKGYSIYMNLVFRWDVVRNDDTGELDAYIFIMQQRKGLFQPNIIRGIKREEFNKLKKYLLPHWKYLNDIWKPISLINVKPGKEREL